ncbi:MAG TPA: DUF1127 domain-containing protein [Amaricoccus sp.]|jgi:uncharacterized protein YjiS (DUF1127 family)|nr:DUF1127 domain-containing protein [Amaricoccus sp.]
MPRRIDSRALAHPIRWLRGYLLAADRTHERQRSAQQLAALGDHELRDIGLSRADAALIARNPDTLPDRLRRR